MTICELMKTNLKSLIRIHWKLWHRYITQRILIYWQNLSGETDNTAKKDVLPFIKDSGKLDLWNKDFFTSITDGLKENNI